MVLKANSLGHRKLESKLFRFEGKPTSFSFMLLIAVFRISVHTKNQLGSGIIDERARDTNAIIFSFIDFYDDDEGSNYTLRKWCPGRDSLSWFIVSNSRVLFVFPDSVIRFIHLVQKRLQKREQE